MSFHRSARVFFGFCVALLATTALARIEPLTQVHAHNDYNHTRPLRDALDQGFCSVEADIYLVDGKLLVAHNFKDVKPERTLQALYLDPLRERVRQNGGRVFPNGPEFTLLIDLKSEWPIIYPELRNVLTNYSDVLTTFHGNKKQTNAITIIISGNRTMEMFKGETVRYAAIDGTTNDFASTAPASVIPWISPSWKKTFAWKGNGELPPDEKARLAEMVSQTHAHGRQLRFWDAPETEHFWNTILEAGVDIINTDDLAGAAKLFRNRHASAAKPTPTPSPGTLQLTTADYTDRAQAIWTAQIAACLMGFQFEHKVASTTWVDRYPKKTEFAIVDDDWYYEMCAVRAFEKHGVGLTVEQLGEQWLENSCGSWGSSEQARLNLAKGIKAPDCGHPRYNRFWFAIGSQFSADLYGTVAPGMPNLAGKLARDFAHVNGYAEAADGAVFIAGMISLGFVETDTKVIVRKAAQLIHPDSPYRKCIDLVISMAEAGKSAGEIANAVEDRWHIEYPWTINAVANGGITAIGVWFGEGDFLKTMNVVYHAADYTDADCNAANAGSVVAAMHGMKCLPANLVTPLHDRIFGDKLGAVKLTPPVDEKISDLAKRTTVIGEKFLLANGAQLSGDTLSITTQQPVTQPAELFTLGDLTKYWNPDWKLERAGFGGTTFGSASLRGMTYLEGDVLATWPRDPVRGVVFRRDVKLSDTPSLSFQVAADPARAWNLEVYAGNVAVLRKQIEGAADQPERQWQDIKIDLKKFAGKELQLRIYQRTLLANKIPGNAYWKALELK